MIILAAPNNYITYSYHNFLVSVELAFISLQAILSSIIISPFLSVFSQLPTLSLFRAEHVNSKPVIYMLFPFSCILFWLPAAFSDLLSHRQREESPWYSQKYHCLCLLERGKKGHTPPSTPSSLADTVSTSDCTLSGCTSPAPRTRSLEVRKQSLLCCCTRWVQIKPLYFFDWQAEGKPLTGCYCFQQKTVLLH